MEGRKAEGEALGKFRSKRTMFKDPQETLTSLMNRREQQREISKDEEMEKGKITKTEKEQGTRKRPAKVI